MPRLTLSVTGGRALSPRALTALVLLAGALLAGPSAAAPRLPDFNGDGRADLVVPVPFEDLGTATDAGAVHVLYGNASGLTSAGSQFWHQNSSGIPDECEADDRFGETLAWGFFNGDGFDDLAVGVQREDIVAVADAGAVHVLYGSGAGLTAAGNQFWHQNRSGVQDASEAGDLFGARLLAADFDGDGNDDLAAGVPGEGIGRQPGAGAVQVLPGSAAGLQAAGNQFWHQNSPGVADPAEPGDAFGTTLASGDFNGDGRADLVIGVPFEDEGSIPDAGRVHVLYGSGVGLTATGSQLLYQTLSGIADQAEENDRFGEVLAVGDFNGDGQDDLVIAVPRERVGPAAGLGAERAGALHVLYGSPGGLDVSTQQYWHRGVSQVQGTLDIVQEFGSALAVADFNADGRDDLAIGAPGVVLSRGHVNVFYGSTSGLTVEGNRVILQNSAFDSEFLDVEGNEENGDQIGRSLAAGDFNGDGFDDLAIGVPFDDDDLAPTDSGSVNIVYGSAAGLTETGNRKLHQDLAGSPDRAEAGDRFGLHLALGDFNGDGRMDLCVPVPDEDIGTVQNAGAVQVFYGDAAGMSGAGSQFWHQNVAGIADAAETSDRFGDGDWR